MTPRLAGPLTQARRALAELPFVTVTDRGTCHLTIQGGIRLPLSVRFEDEWLTLTCPATRGAEVLPPWQGLLLNGALGGFARLALVPGATTIEARADIAIYDGVDLPGRLAMACDGLRAAARSCRQRPRTEQPDVADARGPRDTPASPRNGTKSDAPERMRITLAPPPPAGNAVSGSFDEDVPTLPALLAEAGWPFVQRSSTRLSADLRVRGQPLKAIIEPAGAHGYRARATLGVFKGPPAATRAALGVLLLTTSAAVRCVRGGADETADDASVFVESCLGATPTVEDTHHALSGLSVAGQMVGREVKALADERIALAYLTARGWSL